MQDRLERIALKIQALDGTVLAISQASREQSQGIEMISVAVNQLSEVTQGNASNAESSAHAAVLLQAQAKDSHQLVAELQVIISGT